MATAHATISGAGEAVRLTLNVLEKRRTGDTRAPGPRTSFSKHDGPPFGQKLAAQLTVASFA